MLIDHFWQFVRTTPLRQFIQNWEVVGDPIVVLDAQNVADYIRAITPDHRDYPVEELTDCRPPWPRVFLRYRWPVYGRVETWGCLVDGMGHNLAQTFIGVRFGPHPDAVCFRWGFGGDLVIEPDSSYMAIDNTTVTDAASFWSHPRLQLIGSSGARLLYMHNYGGGTAYELFRDFDARPTATRSYQGLAYVFYLTAALFHCRNVILDSTPIPSALQKKRMRTGKSHVDKVYSLKVQVPGRTRADFVQRSFRDRETGGVRWHICRGHFKTFTTERPLFGKLTGRYWWPMHARGERELGTITKSYEPQVNKEMTNDATCPLVTK